MLAPPTLGWPHLSTVAVVAPAHQALLQDAVQARLGPALRGLHEEDKRFEHQVEATVHGLFVVAEDVGFHGPWVEAEEVDT